MSPMHIARGGAGTGGSAGAAPHKATVFAPAPSVPIHFDEKPRNGLQPRIAAFWIWLSFVILDFDWDFVFGSELTLEPTRVQVVRTPKLYLQLYGFRLYGVRRLNTRQTRNR